MKTVQWCFEEEKLDFPATKIPGSLLRWLTTGLGSNYDRGMNHFAGLVTLKRIYPWFYHRVFHNWSHVIFFSVTTDSSAFVKSNIKMEHFG